MTRDADGLTTAVEKLFGQTARWTPPRWAASTTSGPSRTDLVYDLVQWLADRGAEAENRDPRPVPRLDDHALPDQLRVVAADLAAAPPVIREAARERVEALRRALR